MGSHRQSDLLTNCVSLKGEQQSWDGTRAVLAPGLQQTGDVGRHPKVSSELIINLPERSGLLYAFLGLNQAPIADKCLLFHPL